MIINEWQLDVKLNSAVQSARRADFAWYLALLSPAIEESAQFFTPEPVTETLQRNLYQQLGIAPERSLALSEGDDDKLQQHSEALQADSFAQLRLLSYLNPPPLSQYDDKRRISDLVWQNLSLHSRRHLQQKTMGKNLANPAALYEVLEKIHNTELSPEVA